ncbi:hypothetical protein GS597_09115 [Synechococcales cyanobacterium C]|uniref:Uncharacterized protein n=1 Tax=Petrachloros mirabilis ULC683 TaxID=2781853 RepID=A0A8K1ZZF8_9CYAN|nr:hypothetical protein [Petrachloros mirabilis]NCJ06662.1 hypothetical protein [Petrachloros mirabilis ULC683]
MNSDYLDLEQAFRADVRWRILRAAYISRPTPLTERILLIALRSADLSVTPLELQRQSAYLRDKGLIEVEHTPAGVRLSPTSVGIDVVEGILPCPPGVHCSPVN